MLGVAGEDKAEPVVGLLGVVGVGVGVIVVLGVGVEGTVGLVDAEGEGGRALGGGD